MNGTISILSTLACARSGPHLSKVFLSNLFLSKKLRKKEEKFNLKLFDYIRVGANRTQQKDLISLIKQCKPKVSRCVLQNYKLKTKLQIVL